MQKKTVVVRKCKSHRTGIAVFAILMFGCSIIVPNLYDLTPETKLMATNLIRVIYGLGIAGIGLANAKVLCKEFDYNLEKLRSATVEELSLIDGIGGVLAGGIVDFFAKESNNIVLDALMQELVLEQVESGNEEQIFAGNVFVITGSVEHFVNRNEVKDVIEARGGKVTGSVTSKTDYLINNDVNSTSGKNKKAKELGVPIISEEEFLAMLE